MQTLTCNVQLNLDKLNLHNLFQYINYVMINYFYFPQIKRNKVLRICTQFSINN